MNEYKAEFANTINEIGTHANLSANECERYGMTWGCDENCPVFRCGKCKMEDVEAFRVQILNTDRFLSLSCEELNNLYPKLNLPIIKQ